jgi:hypothetical protein
MPATKKKNIVSVAVDLEVLTNDKLRKLIFGLKKNTEGELVKWRIDFELLDREKKSEAFERAVFISVDLDVKKAPVTKLEATVEKGLDSRQVAYAETVVSRNATRLERKEITEEAMGSSIHGLIRARK